MIDLALLKMCDKAVESKPRQHVTSAILAAVVMRESSGLPYFVDTKPGSQYHQNMVAAKKITGFSEGKIRQLATISAKIGDFAPPKYLVGQVAKFRCEPSYWNRNLLEPVPGRPGYSNDLNQEDRFIYSCSWGVCQFMGPNISGKKHDPESILFIKRFAADVPMQLLYGAGMIDDLLVETHGDIERMYRGYNSGNINSQDPKVLAEADEVLATAESIQAFINSRNTQKE